MVTASSRSAAQGARGQHQPALVATEDGAWCFEAAIEALYANHWIEIDYRKANGERKQWKVMPLGLAQQDHRLYLVVRFDGCIDLL